MVMVLSLGGFKNFFNGSIIFTRFFYNSTRYSFPTSFPRLSLQICNVDVYQISEMGTTILPALSLLLCKEMYLMQHYVSTIYSYQRNKMMMSQDVTKFTPPSPFFPKRSLQGKRSRWGLKFALDTGGFPTNGSQDNDINEDSPGLGQTRLSRILIAAGRQLLGKLNSARKSFPMKVFLLLLGFYTANALATILGQTGDWDVLVAGIVVAAIEGIGMLMYKRTTSSSTRLKSLIVLINYWKAGVCLGLFVDSFKVGS